MSTNPVTAEAPEVRRSRSTTWIALLVITVGAACGFMLDTDADPAAQGLLAAVAALQVMVALHWWRRNRRG